jgi:hypothetical protein
MEIEREILEIKKVLKLDSESFIIEIDILIRNIPNVKYALNNTKGYKKTIETIKKNIKMYNITKELSYLNLILISLNSSIVKLNAMGLTNYEPSDIEFF